MANVHAQQTQAPSAGRVTSIDTARGLLLCGVIAGPLFVVVSFAQALMRQGFDLARQPISLLLLGDLGWVQLINFEASGLLAIAFAVGVRRLLHPGRAGTWGPVFIGAYGVGLVIAGIFGPDPSMGFPPGAPEGIPTSMSTHSAIHGAAFLVSLVGLVGSCIVFARRFASLHRSGWVTYCVATAVAAPVLIVLSNAMMSRGRGGLALFGVAIVMSAWLALLAVRLLADRSAETPLLRGDG